MLPRLLDYIRKRRRTFEVPMPKINALRFAMIGASTGRGRDRPKANLRKFRGYSNDCQNQKYEAISGGFLAGGPGFEPRLTESESAVLPLNYPPTGARIARVIARGREPRVNSEAGGPAQAFRAPRAGDHAKRGGGGATQHVGTLRQPEAIALPPHTCSTATMPGAALSAPAIAALTA